MNLTDELAWAVAREREEQARAIRADLSRVSTHEPTANPNADHGAVVSVRELRKTYTGGVEALKGISFVKANSLDAALEMAKACPHLDIGGSIVVAEVMEMKGM